MEIHIIPLQQYHVLEVVGPISTRFTQQFWLLNKLCGIIFLRLYFFIAAQIDQAAWPIWITVTRPYMK